MNVYMYRVAIQAGGELRSRELKETINMTQGIRKMKPSLGGLEPPTFRLTAERANRLRHRDMSFRRPLYGHW